MTADTPNANTAAVNKIRFIESSSLFWIEHDLFGKPVPTFPDHAPFIERRVRHEIIMSNPAGCGIFREVVAGSERVPALRLADRDPDPLGGGGHVDVVDLVLAPQPLDDRIDHRRTGADRARLAGALHAQGIGGAGDVMGLEVERRAV